MKNMVNLGPLEITVRNWVLSEKIFAGNLFLTEEPYNLQKKLREPYFWRISC
jgi:hypothetical protein